MTTRKKKATKKEKATKKHSAPIVGRGLIITLIVLVVLGLGGTAFAFVYTSSYDGRLFPGTSVGQFDLSGLTFDEAQAELIQRSQVIADAEFTIIYNDKKHIFPSIIGDEANPDLATPLITYDIDGTIDELISVTNTQTSIEQLYNWATGWQVSPAFAIDSDALFEALQEELSIYEEPAVDAQLVIAEDGSMSIAAERSGVAFDYDEIISAMVAQLARLESPQVTAVLYSDTPEVTAAVAEATLPLAKKALAGAPYFVAYNEYRWELSVEQVRQWLTFYVMDGGPTVGLSRVLLAAYVDEMASKINVDVQEARFQLENGRVTEFQPSLTGLAVQKDEAYSSIDQALREQSSEDIQLSVAEVEPVQTTDSLNDLGIQELLGEGYSNFSGSPKNRRHNIAIGAAALNGRLIAPGDEFSLIGALGDIDAASGYLQELVIKGNKTIPEYGGGLCQVSTTTFRAVLDAGLGVTTRRNHSYRVSYYEPVGTDATIYDPAPDFKFVNDTENHVLLTTEISGDDLIFRFYGTADGRQVSQTKPRVYNIVKPPPPKLIETTDLAPGVKKCTERAHDGADTTFTRTITYADGTTNLDEFRSHYIPWQEVCLIGVQELTPEVETTGEV